MKSRERNERKGRGRGERTRGDRSRVEDKAERGTETRKEHLGPVT